MATFWQELDRDLDALMQDIRLAWARGAAG
jgi:hypothetical protein